MGQHQLPILYSFRRCPYAMRARMALMYAGVHCELREVDLKNKPAPMLEISPKGTVPVLVLTDGTVLEESLDIMQWAVHQNDPGDWGDVLFDDIADPFASSFIGAVHRYKYPERFADENINLDRRKDIVKGYLADLNHRLSLQTFVAADRVTFSDVGIFPFIRQCRLVDADWFDQQDFPKVHAWLDYLLNSEYYIQAMKRVPAWQPEQDLVELP